MSDQCVHEGCADTTAKPISNLWKLREHLEERFRTGGTPRVAVIGGGPTGCEIAAKFIALAKCHGISMPVTLITPGDRLITHAPAGAARSLRRSLERAGVTIRMRTRVSHRERETLLAEDGSRIAADIVVLATGLEANSLVGKTSLPILRTKGLRVNASLHSVADPRVFAGGDCAAMENHDLPKLGVFGVRQASYIQSNLLASLDGQPLTHYAPQKRYLAILNLGDGTGLATWGPFWWRRRSSMWLKD
ncbi:MAG: NADH dehydrogenase FAD-containing subunit [Verrucomicrobiales bacterium]